MNSSKKNKQFRRGDQHYKINHNKMGIISAAGSGLDPPGRNREVFHRHHLNQMLAF